MGTFLVTGGAGGLGRDVVDGLLASGHPTSVLTHRQDAWISSGAEMAHGDLRSGAGVEAALAGVSVVIHCASNAREADFATDIEGTRSLVRATRAAGIAHLVFISIVGVERSDYPYYQAKREAERIVESGDVPWTIVRATQFHDLVSWLLGTWDDGTAPLKVSAGMRFQSVARHEVAARLIAVAAGSPTGYSPPMRGPETLTIEEMARAYLLARHRDTPIMAVPSGDGMYAVFRSGVNLLPEDATATRGRETWADYLRRGAART